jgi:hypothetical protein
MARSGRAKDVRGICRLLHFTTWVTVSASRIDGDESDASRIKSSELLLLSPQIDKQTIVYSGTTSWPNPLPNVVWMPRQL